MTNSKFSYIPTDLDAPGSKCVGWTKILTSTIILWGPIHSKSSKWLSLSKGRARKVLKLEPGIMVYMGVIKIYKSANYLNDILPLG